MVCGKGKFQPFFCNSSTFFLRTSDVLWALVDGRGKQTIKKGFIPLFHSHLHRTMNFYQNQPTVEKPARMFLVLAVGFIRNVVRPPCRRRETVSWGFFFYGKGIRTGLGVCQIIAQLREKKFARRADTNTPVLGRWAGFDVRWGRTCDSERGVF